MENYIVIQGKKIELLQEVIYNITKQLKKEKEGLFYKEIVQEILKNSGYYIENVIANIYKGSFVKDNDICAGISEYQRQCLLARNKLVNIAIYLNEGWIPIWGEIPNNKYYIILTTFSDGSNGLRVNTLYYSNSGEIYFKTKELALKAIEILCEDTIRKVLTGNFKKE